MDATVEARPDDVQLTLAWAADADGGLAGELRALNVSRRPVRLTGKPALLVLGSDGEPLGAACVWTAELRVPNYADIGPGEEAVAPVGWGGWDGDPASGDVVVRLPGGDSLVRVSGPHQPAASGPATNLWSSWFTNAGSHRKRH